MLLKIAHRGASGYEAENTLKAFRKAISLGADMVELDIHLTKDGEAVVIHDDTLDRTTSGKGKVSEKTLAEIKKLRIKDQKLKIQKDQRVPTLDEVVVLVKNFCDIMIEIKDEKASQKVLEILEKHNYLSHCIITSSNLDIVEKVNELNPKVQTGIIVEASQGSWTRSLLNLGGLISSLAWKHAILAKAKKNNSTVICLEKSLVSLEIVTYFHQQRMQLYIWTVNDIEEIKTMKAMGVDGIISDFPDRIK